MPNSSNKVAIVTGAGSGIGEATAKLMAENGFKVYGTSRKGSQGRTGDGFEMLSLDVTEEKSIEALIAEVLQREGRIDVLVNNAGFGLAGGAEEASTDQLHSVFETNFFGCVKMIQAVLPQMRKQSSGRIINISSIFGEVPAPFMAIYGASKHAIEGYSESLDHEIRSFNIRSILVQPAHTKSNFDKNTATAENRIPIYDKGRKALSILVANDKYADRVETVAATVLKAATSVRPQVRYAGSPNASRILSFRRFAPVLVFETILRNAMKLDA